MNPPPDTSLVELTKAANAIEMVDDFSVVAEIRDKAQAVVSLGKRIELAEGIGIEAGLIKVRAERRMGQLLRKLNLDKGGRPKKDSAGNSLPHATGLTLKDLKLSPTESSRYQKIGQLPEKNFNAYTTGEVEANRPPTTSGVLRVAKRYYAKEKAKKSPQQEGFVTNLDDLVKEGHQYATLLCDFPWQYRNKSGRGAAENHYGTLSIEQLEELPIPTLAAKSSLLFLWTTNSFLKEALHLIEVYGFQYKSSFIWAKPQLGVGNYWRVSHEVLMIASRGGIVDSHEFLLLGTKGGEPFQDTNFRSWQEYPRLRHSEKPSEIHAMLESLSLEPRLELFGRKKAPGWTVFGNQLLPD